MAGLERRFWASLVLVAVVLALGRHNPALPWLYSVAPEIIGKFRYPEKFMFVAISRRAFSSRKEPQLGFAAIVARNVLPVWRP